MSFNKDLENKKRRTSCLLKVRFVLTVDTTEPILLHSDTRRRGLISTHSTTPSQLPITKSIPSGVNTTDRKSRVVRNSLKNWPVRAFKITTLSSIVTAMYCPSGLNRMPYGMDFISSECGRTVPSRQFQMLKVRGSAIAARRRPSGEKSIHERKWCEPRTLRTRFLDMSQI